MQYICFFCLKIYAEEMSQYGANKAELDLSIDLDLNETTGIGSLVST